MSERAQGMEAAGTQFMEGQEGNVQVRERPLIHVREIEATSTCWRNRSERTGVNVD